MIRILFFIDTTLASGGAEKVLRTLVNNMDQSKFDITVQTVDPAEPKAYLAPEIRYKAINRAKTAMGKKFMSCWIRLCAQLKWLYPLYIKDDYDIEVAYLECGPTKILAGSTNKKALKLAWVHCDLQRMTENPAAFAEKSKQWYRAYDKVVCVSEQVLKSYRQLFGDAPQSLVIHNTVDDAEICRKAALPCPGLPRKTRPVIATVGRLYRQKGYDRLLDAHHRLLRDGRECDLWILGEGPEREMLTEQVHRFGTEEYVHFLGFQENPYPFMKAADMIVCSSYYEGFSTVVTEALILGKPVVTTPCSGMDELLGNSEFGIITDDTTGGIYLGLKQLLDNPTLRQHYAEAAQRRGRTFGKESLVTATEEFFVRELEQKK